MIKVLAIYSGHEFTKFERFFIFIGVVLLSISTLTGLLNYGFSWKLVSPGYHALATLFGILFSYIGVKVAAKLMLTKANDLLGAYWLYRLTAWVTRKAFSGVVFVAAVIFYSWIRQSPPSYDHSYADQQDRGPDDIWDSHPRHYYDQEPPKPFS